LANTAQHTPPRTAALPRMQALPGGGCGLVWLGKADSQYTDGAPSDEQGHHARRKLLGRYWPLFRGPRRGLRSMRHAELSEQVLQVCLDGAHAYSKLGPNLAVRLASPNQL
jgi:hypothetical protein